MSIGWVKLHRKLLKSRVFANEGLLRVWIYCLCRANHEVNYVPIKTGKGETEVQVNPGDFVFGRNTVASDLNMNPSTLYKRMKKLEEMDNINMQSNSQYSVVSICNWEAYQNPEYEKEQPKEQAGNNQVTGREQPSNTDNNVNNDKNDKNIPPTRAQVEEYFSSRGDMILDDVSREAENFINHYEERDWQNSSGKKITAWKRQAATWNNKYLQYNEDRLEKRNQSQNGTINLEIPGMI